MTNRKGWQLRGNGKKPSPHRTSTNLNLNSDPYKFVSETLMRLILPSLRIWLSKSFLLQTLDVLSRINETPSKYVDMKGFCPKTSKPDSWIFPIRNYLDSTKMGLRGSKLWNLFWRDGLVCWVFYRSKEYNHIYSPYLPPFLIDTIYRYGRTFLINTIYMSNGLGSPYLKISLYDTKVLPKIFFQ